MSQTGWQVGSTTLELLENIDTDLSWTRCLPPDTEIMSTEASGAASFWSRTARVNARLSTGEDKSYFFKLMDGDLGRMMAEGEHASMTALHSVAPDMVPKPVGWGTLENTPNSHFFISDYIELSEEIPDPSSFCPKLAEMHRKSMEKSSNGKYGFDFTTCNGTLAQDNTWDISWERFFSRQTEGAFRAEQEVHGTCEEYERLLPLLFSKVIPRLLRPLETGGNHIRPVLVHGDLWDGNVSFDDQNDRPYIYDASAFWGHNEYEMHNWRGTRFTMRKAYVKEYFKHFPMSAPQAEWDDRNLLYSLRADLHDSYLLPETKNIRGLVIATLETLVRKFPNGYEGPYTCKGTTEDTTSSSMDHEQSVVHTAQSSSSGHSSAATTEPAGQQSTTTQSDNGKSMTYAQKRMAEVAGTIGMITSTSERSGSEVRFGESAISPFSGSEVGGFQP